MTLTLKQELQNIGINCQEDLQVDGISTNPGNPTRFSTSETKSGDESGWAILFNNSDGSQVIKAACYRENVEGSIVVKKGGKAFKKESEAERVSSALRLSSLPMVTAGGRYLINRGIKESTIRQLSPDVRFLDNTGYWITDKNKNYKHILTSSVIVSIIRDENLAQVGWHKIHMDNDGNKPQRLLDENRTTKKVKKGDNVQKLENCTIKVFDAVPNNDEIGIVEGVESGIALRQLGFQGVIYSLYSTAGFKTLKLPTGSKIYLGSEGDEANKKAMHAFYVNNSDSDVFVWHFGDKTDANDAILKGVTELPAAVSYMQFKQVKPNSLATLSAPEEIVEGELVVEPKAFPVVTLAPNGEVKKVNAIQENMEVLLNNYEIKVRFNEMSRKEEINFTTMSEQEKRSRGYLADAGEETMMSRIIDLADIERMPIPRVPELVSVCSKRDSYHPVKEWIESKKWDGVSRFDDVLATIKVRSDENHAKRIYLKRWFISIVAALYKKGFKAEGTLTFTGNQGKGKTAWAISLFPKDFKATGAGLSIEPSDKDSVMKCTKTLVTELGEIDNTFKKSDIAALKAFLTNETDDYRPPYGRKIIENKRQTVFYGSVNHEAFLQDTENRRFWVLTAEEVKTLEGIDTQQFFAEVKTWFDDGEQWWLSDDERAMLHKVNERYAAEQEGYSEIIETFYNDKGKRKSFIPVSPREAERALRELRAAKANSKHLGNVCEEDYRAQELDLSKPHQTSAILKAIGVENPKQAQLNKTASLLKDLLGATKRKTGGLFKWDLPEQIDTGDEAVAPKEGFTPS